MFSLWAKISSFWSEDIILTFPNKFSAIKDNNIPPGEHSFATVHVARITEIINKWKVKHEFPTAVRISPEAHWSCTYANPTCIAEHSDLTWSKFKTTCWFEDVYRRVLTALRASASVWAHTWEFGPVLWLNIAVDRCVLVAKFVHKKKTNTTTYETHGLLKDLCCKRSK